MSVVLVEGSSDRIALETLASRRGLEVSVVDIGGAQAIARVAAGFRDVRVVGLCDAQEEAIFRRELDDVHVCVEDLEDELIRALGAAAVQQLLAANGDLVPFRTMQKQLEWRARPVEAQLRRFFGSGARRKLRYARLLVEALELDAVPTPLDAALESATRG